MKVRTTEQSDLLLQSLSARALKDIAANAPFTIGGFNGIVEEDTISEDDFLLQSMSVSELSKAFYIFLEFRKIITY